MTARGQSQVMTARGQEGLSGSLMGMRPSEEVEAFLARNNVDKNAAFRFRAIPWEVQRVVIGRGKCDGPMGGTQVLLQRIAEDLEKFQIARPTMYEPTEQNNVDMYLASAPIEPHAAKRFRSLSRELQLQIMASKVLKHCRDPTMQLYGMISKAEFSSTSINAPASASAPSRAAPVEEDEDIDAAMKQIIEDEKQKANKNKRPRKPDLGAALKKAAVAAKADPPKGASAPAAEPDLSADVDKAFNALRSKLGGDESKSISSNAAATPKPAAWKKLGGLLGERLQDSPPPQRRKTLVEQQKEEGWYPLADAPPATRLLEKMFSGEI